MNFNTLIGGKYGDYKVPEEGIDHPRTKRAFKAIMVLLSAEIAVGGVALMLAFLWRDQPGLVTPAVWFRGVVVLFMTATLFFFTYKAAQGYYWAYSRLRLFSQIFPVVTLVITAIPGVYPLWMTIEQIVFSVLLIGVSDYLRSDHMRDVFPKPQKTGYVPPIQVEHNRGE